MLKENSGEQELNLADGWADGCQFEFPDKTTAVSYMLNILIVEMDVIKAAP